MPYFKLSYKDGSEKVVHAQKGSYPYRDGNEKIFKHMVKNIIFSFWC